jgi:phenylpyruvate tautomerase PptA (4-oxalocrotonate tautomerase family)
MPLWHIYYSEGTYSDEDRKNLANDITQLYAQFGLPRFYVSVMFERLPADHFFIGGKPTSDFVRIWIDQIARRLPPEARWKWMQRVNAVLEPYTKGKGLRWEIHIDETPDDMWTIDGMKPPAGRSEQEKKWAEDDVASPYEPYNPDSYAEKAAAGT